MINIEYELRYYYPSHDLDMLNEMLGSIKELKKENRIYEKTMQYDHPNKYLSFYSKELDGRFRIRISKNDDISKCKISWKRRLETTKATDVNEEEEVELTIKYEEYENLLFIINNVLKMKLIESYERYRTVYYNEEIEISIDEYPFGIALEIESKNLINPKETVKKYVDILNLDKNKAYRLSWDDKYTELCKEQNIDIFNHVTFDLPMPKIHD